MYWTLLGCNGDVLNLYYACFSGRRMYWNCNQDVLDSSVFVFKLYLQTLMIPLAMHPSIKMAQPQPPPSTPAPPPTPRPFRPSPFAVPLLVNLQLQHRRRLHWLLQPLLQPLAWNDVSTPHASPYGDLHETWGAWPATSPALSCSLPGRIHIIAC